MQIRKLILFLCVISWVCSSSNFTVLVNGNLRNGKSTVVNAIMSENVSTVENEDGEPTTESHTLYKESYDFKINLLIQKVLNHNRAFWMCNNIKTIFKFVSDTNCLKKIDSIFFFLYANTDIQTIGKRLQKLKYFGRESISR